MPDDPYYLEFEGKLKPGWKKAGYWDEMMKRKRPSTYRKIYNDEPAMTREELEAYYQKIEDEHTQLKPDPYWQEKLK